jgi:hypothetical protein
MKRVLSAVFIVCSLWTLCSGVADFNHAKNGFELFKAIFWMILGGGAFVLSLDDFKKNEWPL